MTEIKGALIVPKSDLTIMMYSVTKNRVYEVTGIETHEDTIVLWYYDDKGFLTYTTNNEDLFDIYYQV